MPVPKELASREKSEAAMDVLADGLDGAPLLVLEALAREAIYEHQGGGSLLRIGGGASASGDPRL